MITLIYKTIIINFIEINSRYLNSQKKKCSKNKMFLSIIYEQKFSLATLSITNGSQIDFLFSL